LRKRQYRYRTKNNYSYDPSNHNPLLISNIKAEILNKSKETIQMTVCFCNSS
jgi:hypothetical protein